MQIEIKQLKLNKLKQSESTSAVYFDYKIEFKFVKTKLKPMALGQPTELPQRF